MSALDADREQALVAAAREAQTRAVAPYSNFGVGAALLLSGGEIVTGCNVENATYGLTLCAERVALVKALSDGKRGFLALAVTANAALPTPPCGACRQLLWEFGGDLEVILANRERVTARFKLSELLPHPFDARFLGH